VSITEPPKSDVLAPPPDAKDDAIREALALLDDQLAAQDKDCGDPTCDQCNGTRRSLQRV
jgi:hypothetical protein